MAAPHGAVTGPPPGVRLDWLRAAPALAVLAFALPIGAGLLGTVLPAFGYLPAIGAQQWYSRSSKPTTPAEIIDKPVEIGGIPPVVPEVPKVGPRVHPTR